MARLVHNIQKKQHRERSQISERRHLGLLEKKKDYKLRAENYHAKEAKLKLLRKKAKERNPDEFYFGMHSTKTDEHGIGYKENPLDIAERELSADAKKLLQTQDATYVRTMRLKELRVIERMQAELMPKATGKHVIFVNSEKEQEEFDAADYFQTDKTLLNKRENRLKLDQLGEKQTHTQELDEGINKERVSRLKKLAAHIERERELAIVEQRLDLDRELAKSGEREKVVKDGKVTYKWKAERKK